MEPITPPPGHIPSMPKTRPPTIPPKMPSTISAAHPRNPLAFNAVRQQYLRNGS